MTDGTCSRKMREKRLRELLLLYVNQSKRKRQKDTEDRLSYDGLQYWRGMGREWPETPSLDQTRKETVK